MFAVTVIVCACCGFTVNVPFTYATTKPAGATAPEQLIGYTPGGLLLVAVVVQTGLVSNAGVVGLAVKVSGGTGPPCTIDASFAMTVMVCGPPPRQSRSEPVSAKVARLFKVVALARNLRFCPTEVFVPPGGVTQTE